MILKEKIFYKEVRKRENIIIYGAGMIGKRIWEKLHYCEDSADVISFAVTKKEENYEQALNPFKQIKNSVAQS